MRSVIRTVVAGLLMATFAHGASYKEIAKYKIGGDGGWDYVKFDEAANRLFIAHGMEILVVDAGSGEQVGTIRANGAHGVALAPNGKGFISNGRAGTITVFDQKSLKPEQDIKVGENPDAIIYDPYSKRVVVMNGRSKELSIIDPDSLKVTNTVPLGGKLEFAAADSGHVYVNVEDKGEIADVDSSTWKPLHTWKLADCEEPSGLAIDTKNKRLFDVCGNKKMLVVDAKDGRVLATLPTGDGTDAAGFDPGTGFAFASNGEGTLTVVNTAHGKFKVEQNVTTQRGARTMAIDPKTHRVFLITAEFGAPVEGQRWPPIKPGSFVVLVYGLEK